MLQDLPDELTFQRFLWQPLHLDPVGASNSCAMQAGVIGNLAAKEGGEVEQLGNGNRGGPEAALSSVASDAWLRCDVAVNRWCPVGHGRGGLAMPGFWAGLRRPL